jgi:hypothetical protein
VQGILMQLPIITVRILAHAAKTLIIMSLWPEYGCSYFGLLLMMFTV